MIKIRIDDRDIEVPENQTVLAAAKENGFKIPHLCYHPALKALGSCKLCGVEVVSASGRPIIMLACILKVKDNMDIKTGSDRVIAHRQKTFNRLLQMAPESHRIRSLAAAFNVPVIPPPDGCIRCRLCVRVCTEVVGAKALKMEKTDQGRQLSVNQGHCIGCGTCANLCPTGYIRVTDKQGVREVCFEDHIVGRQPLERCESCGNPYATFTFLKHVEMAIRPHPDTKVHHHLCPACSKMMSDRAKAEKVKIKK
jgi:bidirectional [NiFe] hydrogenase diaphorase subunit